MFIYLICSKSEDNELIKAIKSIFKIKIFSKYDIIKRVKILYDRYHGFLDVSKSEFWYMSCKMHEKKNILTLFQNNKQIYCNIDCIYDCSLHSSIDPNFDNPSCYDEIKYLKTYKKLLEYSFYYLFGDNSNNNNINNINNNENNMAIDSLIENDNIDESIPISLSRSDDKKNKEAINNINNNLNNITVNNNNINNNYTSNNNNNNTNDLASNASSKIISYNTSKENEEINYEIILENKDGTNKIINLNKKKDEENTNNINTTNNNVNTNNNNANNNNNISSNNNDSLKNHIIDLVLDFNQTLKNIKCQNGIVSQIKKIKFMTREDKKPCSELCYKNFLSCEENLYNQSYLYLKDKSFPTIYELLFIKFIQMVKFDPCHICKLMQAFMDTKNTEFSLNFKLNCSDIYIHLLSQKFRLKNIIKKELFDLNIKERELGKKNRASITPIQSKKIEENNLKKKNLTYIPCVHFGNEICDEKCPCSKRGYCEIYCKCNQILCKFAYHGCHCSKGDCTTNHCPCFMNGRECNPHRCKNCGFCSGMNNNDRCKNIQLQQDFESKLIVGMSEIAGWGLFANEDIKKDCLIGEYKGELINDDIVNNRDRFKDYEGSTYMFKLDDEYTVDSRRMGNMLRYANHSKVNSNSYTKIVFSGGHRKIGLFAKRNIKKGEEILFDYDGQGILGKQFYWINNEKKIVNHNNQNITNITISNNNENSNNKINNNNNDNEKNNIPTIDLNNNLIDNDIILINNDINNNNNYNSKHKKRKKFSKKIKTLKNSLKTEKKNKKEIQMIENINNNNNNLKDNLKNNSNIISNLININEEANNKSEISKSYIEKNSYIKKDTKKESQKVNLIDILSDKNYCTNYKEKSKDKDKDKEKEKEKEVVKFKNLFKIEEDEIKDIKQRYEKDKNNNVFNLMDKIREKLTKNDDRSYYNYNNKLLSKKRYEPKNENKSQTDKININLNYNFNNNNLINNENNGNIIMDKIFPNNSYNLQNVLFKEIPNNIFDNEKNNGNEMKINIEINKEDNEIKLKKPIFVGQIQDNHFIKYNFIKCEYFNNSINKQIKNEMNNKINNNFNYNNIRKINEVSSNNFNYINNLTNFSTVNNLMINNNTNTNINTNPYQNNPNNNNNSNNQTKNKTINTVHNIGTIRLLLNFENPIINDFSFFSPINTDKLRNIEYLECKTLDLIHHVLNIDFEKDICGYLDRNSANKGQRLFKDYLDCFENMAYYCDIPNINSELYIVSKGPIFSQIKEKYYFNKGKNKKLLFVIKQK